MWYCASILSVLYPVLYAILASCTLNMKWSMCMLLHKATRRTCNVCQILQIYGFVRVCLRFVLLRSKVKHVGSFADCPVLGLYNPRMLRFLHDARIGVVLRLTAICALHLHQCQSWLSTALRWETSQLLNNWRVFRLHVLIVMVTIYLCGGQLVYFGRRIGWDLMIFF